jgi:hydrogenase maturation factor
VLISQIGKLISESDTYSITCIFQPHNVSIIGGYSEFEMLNVKFFHLFPLLIYK